MYSNISQILLLYKTWRYNSKFDSTKPLGVPMGQNITMRVNWSWNKRYCLFCSKAYNTLESCHNFPAGSREAARVARICETSLLNHSTKLGMKKIHPVASRDIGSAKSGLQCYQIWQLSGPWASCQIRQIAGCACVGNAGNVFPATVLKGSR